MCQEKSCVQAALMKVSIDHLLDNLELGKIKYCFGKKSGKVLNFGSKKSVQTLLLTKSKPCIYC